MKAKATNYKRIAFVVCALFLWAFLLCQNVFILVKADDPETSVKDYAATDIMEDLSDIDVLKYPQNPLGSLEVIRFQEYCYSDKPFYAEYYGLYLYIYNPTETALDLEKKSLVNMAVSYDEQDKPTYQNVELAYCDKTDNNRFYKFQVDINYLSVAQAYAKTHDGERRYDFVGITLYYENATLLNSEQADRNYAKTYYYKGYAKGLSDSSEKESTLSCRVDVLETLKLNVSHANYRTLEFTDVSNGSICDELQTVYFSVPEKYFTNYGGLQKIKAEWYEYKTSEIFVTSDSGAYDALFPFIGVDVGNGNEDLPWRVYWEEIYLQGSGTDYNKSYNTAGNVSGVAHSRIDWLFEKAGATSRESYNVTAEDIIAYMNWYTLKYPNQSKIHSKYAENLFTSSIDSDRLELLEDKTATSGKIVQEIDAEKDTQDLMKVDESQSWWSKLWNGTQFVEKSYSPIVVLDKTNGIDSMTADTFGRTYLISDTYAQACLDYCKAEIAKGNKAVLFRFAVTDYYASTAYFDSTKNILFSDADGYVAQMSMFLDFDIISLSFRDLGGKETVIGTVSDPIDIINGTDAPPGIEDKDWKEILKEILSILITGAIIAAIVIGGCLLAFYCKPLFDVIVKGIVWLITAPFRFFKWLFTRGKKK